MKRSVEELAVLGGRPAFDPPLHVGRPNIGNVNKMAARLEGILRRRRLTNDGPLVKEFESRLCEVLGVEHCVATSSGTSALELMLAAADVSGAVIVPSFTFIGTAHAVAWRGGEPRFADLAPDSAGVSPFEVEALVTDDVTAVIGAHLWGRACDAEPLTEIANRHGLRLFFDGAHAFGCTAAGRPVAQWGDATAMSFHATKVVNSFEGGVIATSDATIAAKTRLLRNFGFRDYDDVAVVGTNAKMTEPAAAMGLTSLESYERFKDVNRAHFARYAANLASIAGITVLEYPKEEDSNYHYVIITVDSLVAGLARDGLQRVLWAEGVHARRYFYPGCHLTAPYRSLVPPRPLPHTETLASRALALPTGEAVASSQIDEVCALIRIALRSSETVRRALGS